MKPVRVTSRRFESKIDSRVWIVAVGGHAIDVTGMADRARELSTERVLRSVLPTGKAPRPVGFRIRAWGASPAFGQAVSRSAPTVRAERK